MYRHRPRPMRKPLSGIVAPSLTLIGALLLLVGPMLPAQAQGSFARHRLFQSGTVVSIDPSSAEVDIGDTTTVDVRIEDVTGLAIAEMFVIFDPDVLEVVDADPDTSGVQVEIGSFLGADVVVTENDVDQDAGEIFFSQVASDTVDGSGILASITFQGKAAGTSDVSIDIDDLYLLDSADQAIEASVEDGSITVAGDVTPSPTLEATLASTPTPTRTPTPGPTSAPTSTSAPTRTPPPQPTATASIQSRVLQLWPDRSVGVTSGLLEGAASHADTQVLPFGDLEGKTVRARTYLHFPLDVFPLGTEIKQATLYVYVDSASGLGKATFGAYRVLKPWDETGWNGEPTAWPALLPSPIAITEASFEAKEARLPAPSVPRLALIVAQDSPLPTPTPPSSVLPTSTSPTSTATPTSKTASAPTSTRTPGPTSSPASTPTTSPLPPTPVTYPPGTVVELEPTEGRWLMWDVTALMRAWLADEVPDHGLALAAASDSGAGLEAATDLLLARWLTADDPNTMPYVVADIVIHPVTPTPTPTSVPILPIAGSSGGWSGTVILLAGAALLVLGLALAVRHGRSKV